MTGVTGPFAVAHSHCCEWVPTGEHALCARAGAGRRERRAALRGGGRGQRAAAHRAGCGICSAVPEGRLLSSSAQCKQDMSPVRTVEPEVSPETGSQAVDEHAPLLLMQRDCCVLLRCALAKLMQDTCPAVAVEASSRAAWRGRRCACLSAGRAGIEIRNHVLRLCRDLDVSKCLMALLRALQALPCWAATRGRRSGTATARRARASRRPSPRSCCVCRPCSLRCPPVAKLQVARAPWGPPVLRQPLPRMMDLSPRVQGPVFRITKTP